MNDAISSSRHTIESHNSSFSYLKFGRGKKLLIALPGYANEADLFLKIASALLDEFTVIALDLPWHGETKITADDFRKEDFIAVLKGVITNFPEMTAVEFMGYSYGGRLSLGILSKFNISRLWLIAADGLEARRGYNFFPVTLRRLLSDLMRQPHWFLKMLSFLHKIRIVPKYTHRFMTHHLGNEENKSRLLGTWIFTADFVSNQKELLQSLQEKQIPVVLIYGRQDKIIHSEGGLKLKDNYPLAEVHFIEARHKIFGRNLERFLKDYLKK
ncbi:MAG: pimeloyl-ACP methyl ester carboxylesterase [Saprospiraceae bacterium]